MASVRMVTMMNLGGSKGLKLASKANRTAQSIIRGRERRPFSENRGVRRLAVSLSVFCSNVLLMGWSISLPAQQPTHPLDGLSAQELRAVADIIMRSGRTDSSWRFASVLLHEPPKDEVLRHESGQRFRREALAVLAHGGRTLEAVVDVPGGRILSWTERRGVQPNLMASEFQLASQLMLHDPRVAVAFQKRGIADLSTVRCDAGSPGYFGTGEEQGRRLARADCVSRSGVRNAYGRPIGGVYGVIDIGARRVVRVIDSGPVPMPEGPVDFDTASVPSRPGLPAIERHQPNGSGVSLQGSKVSWGHWRFHARVDPRVGLVVSDVRYDDGGRLRSVMYQGSLSEIFVPYMDPSDGWYYWTYLDLGEYTAGGFATSLQPDTDCPPGAEFMDAARSTERGVPVEVPRAACLFERADGTIAWRHMDGETGTVESRPRRDLVLRMIGTFENYDYGFDWIFRPDGTIRIEVAATGIIAAKAVAGQRATTDGRDDRYGRFVGEHTVGVNHDHFFNFRLDLDVDGPTNSFVVDSLVAERVPRGVSPRKSVWTIRSRTARREHEAQLHEIMDAPTTWRVVNADTIGPSGYPVGYELVPDHGAVSLLSPDDYPQRRARFTDHALWVTPYRSDERYAAGEYPTQSRGGDGLPAWTASNRPIERSDIVLWYTVGLHHVPRPEDWPVMPAVIHAFELRPVAFFARNPALDLPRVP